MSHGLERIKKIRTIFFPFDVGMSGLDGSVGHWQRSRRFSPLDSAEVDSFRTRDFRTSSRLETETKVSAFSVNGLSRWRNGSPLSNAGGKKKPPRLHRIVSLGVSKNESNAAAQGRTVAVAQDGPGV